MSLSVTALQQAPSDEGAQDALAPGGLHLGYGIRIDTGDRVKDDARRWGLHIGVGINVALARHLLKHPITHTHMEVHMLLQAGAKAVDIRHGADVQGCLVHLLRYGAVSTMLSTAPSR